MLQRYRFMQKLARNGRRLSSSTSSGGKSIGVGAVIVIGGTAATIGAASQIPSFRRSIESNVPQVKGLFESMLGPLETGDVVVAQKSDNLKKKSKHTDIFEAPMKDLKSRKETVIVEENAVNIAPPEISPPQNKSQLESNTTNTQESVRQEQIDNVTSTEEASHTAPEIVIPDLPIDTGSQGEDDSTSVPVALDPAENVEAHNIDNIPAPSLNNELVETLTEETSLSPNSTMRTPEQVEAELNNLEEGVLANEAAISAILDDTLSSCASRCSEAIESNNEAAEAVGLHTDLLKAAMNDKDSPKEDHDKWGDISRVLEQKSRLQSEAESLTHDARQELAKLEEVMAQFKESKSDVIIRKILRVEETCNDMRRELDDSVKNTNVKLSESHVISEYKDLVDAAKEQFRRELLSIVPDVKLESSWRKLSQKLSNEDLNALIVHAHRRVDQLQRELAEERAIAVNRIATAVKSARQKWEENAAVEMETKIQVLKRETEIEHDKRVVGIQQDFENEMRIQLKRQAAAHSDHLAEVLGIQEKEIKNKLEADLLNKLSEQEKKFSDQMDKIKTKYEGDAQQISEQFQFDLNKALAKVAGIETAIDGRAYVENESRKAQELWLACEALRVAVQYGDAGKPVPLQKELQAIHNVHGIESNVQDIVSAFPAAASERGVFTEDALRSAYKQVAKVCRRVSLITETRNSFFDYILSYLKSLLIINRAQTEPPIDLDIDNLDTFSILSYATYCLENGDLEQATRFVNQLTGESRRVAEGWIQEARLLLETRQIVEVLSSMATANTIAANMEM